MDTEKIPCDVEHVSQEASPLAESLGNIVEDRYPSISEAFDMYGDAQTAEEYGYVSRGWVVASISQKLPIELLLSGCRRLTSAVKSQISTSPIHRHRWHDWYWSLPGYRQGLDPGGSAQPVARIYPDRNSDFRHGTGELTFIYP
jgi:hypothetical protein